MFEISLPIKEENIIISKWDMRYSQDLYNIMDQPTAKSNGKIDTEKLINRFEMDWDKDYKYECMILDSISDIAIGSIVIKLKYISEKIVEIGYIISKGNSNKGYATKALNMVVGMIRKNNPDIRILAASDRQNCASIRVLKKCGFQEIGHTDLKNGSFVVFEK